jgi:uncharacterized protein YoxC|tara:strand:+ start:730 stop:1200 length:471 start_codon:yes stop_codon:yes gene_type:complete
MAEIEYKGIKVGGSKMLLILPLIGTIMGGLWGGFELFSRYQSMEAKIDSYVAPDLSGFDKRLEVIQSEMDMILQEVTLVADVAKELKNDLRGDVRRIETIVEDVEQKVKNDGRELNKDISDAIKDIKQEMADLEAKIEKQIKLALENPLSNMATTK